MTGCCTSTSTSSWPRSRCCGARSSPAAPWWSGATATPPGRARSWPRRRTRPARSGCAPGCRSARRPAGAPTRCSSRRTGRPTTRRRRGSWRRSGRSRWWSRCGGGTRPSSGPHRRPRGARPSRAGSGCSAETGLSCAVGIGETRLQAKTATGFAKPGGVARLTRRDVDRDDGRAPRHRRCGASATRTARRLADAGIRTVVELARADHHELATPVRPGDRPAPAGAGPGRRRRPRSSTSRTWPALHGGDLHTRPHRRAEIADRSSGWRPR